MNFDSYKIFLETNLIHLDAKKKSLFAFLCCERILPAYINFSNSEKWGNPIVLHEAMNMILSYVKGDQPAQNRMRKVLQELLENTPDSDDFTSVNTSYAQSAVSSIYYTLSFILKKNIDELIWVPILVFEVINMHVTEKLNLPNIDSVIIDNSMEMKRELDKQKTDLKFLLNQSEITPEIIEKLRSYPPIIKIDETLY